jgi:quercetin dioxygenase-like cupin family protein
LTDIPGKEGLVLTVTYPPGGADEIHRHNAHAFVYVLEGSIVMQLRGAEPVAVKAGEGFYEGPNDVHIVGRSASDSKPAKFVVFLVKTRVFRQCFRPSNASRLFERPRWATQEIQT